MDIVYLNGEFLPVERARVSVQDRGFIFGDGVYEVIPAYGGRLFRLDQHLQRLARSLAEIRLTNPASGEQWRQCLQELVTHNGGGDQSVYVQITRGAAPRDHAFPGEVKPTVYAASSVLRPMSPDAAEYGVAAVTLPDIRWQRCDIKAITLLPNILLRQQAIDQGAVEAILTRDGHVNEGAASNLFIVKAGVLLTPPKGPHLLPGITRDLILELAASHGIAYREEPITTGDLALAEEVWLTSSTREILPVTRLDQVAVGNGKPGPLWRKMISLYQDYKQGVRERGEAPAA
ncbi:MAG: D-amino acid aminotransferase [Gammaproteobacteria bacterium]